MRRKLLVFILLGLLLLGSFVTFYATNLLISDVSNYATSNVSKYLIASLPMFILSISIVVASMYVIKLSTNCQNPAALTKRYAISLLVIQVLGLVTTILTGTVVYDSFFAPYPFVGHSIIMLILYVLFITLLCYLIFYKLKGTKIKGIKIPLKEIYYVVLGLLTYYAFNKFGAFMWSVTYVQSRTLYMTLAFYLSQTLPVLLLVQMVLYIFEYYKKSPKEAIIHAFITLGLDIIFTALICYFGLTDTRFMSVVSPAMPLERLITMPVGTILHTLFVTLLSVYALLKAIKNKKNITSK